MYYILLNFRFPSIRCCSFLFYIRHILRLRHWADEIRLKPTSESHWKLFSSLILSFYKKFKSFLKSHFHFYFSKFSFFFWEKQVAKQNNPCWRSSINLFKILKTLLSSKDFKFFQNNDPMTFYYLKIP